MAVGRGQDPSHFGPQPPNVHLEPWIAQTLVLPRCALFVTHGGFNSTKEALSGGVPLVVIPISADQFYCAERCAALGVARVIEPHERTPASIAAAVDAVLADPRDRIRAPEVQRDIAALPGLEHAVTLLEDLVASRLPVTKSP